MIVAEPGARQPDAVLFACNLNSVRSPVAAALLRRRLGRRVFIDSCGLKPASDVDPFAVGVMGEWGGDISAHRPKGFEELTDGSFDLIISLTPEAHLRATELARARAMELEYWPTADPTLETGSRDQVLGAYRRMRDELERRLLGRFPTPAGPPNR